MTRPRLDSHHADDLHLSLGLLFPAAAGLTLFGWRCLGVWTLISVGALATRLLLGRLRTWTARPTKRSLIVQSVLVGLFCPATLFEPDIALLRPDAQWPALVALGMLLTLIDWAVRVRGTRRAHAAVWTAALLTLGVPWLTQTDRVLRPQFAAQGDILDARTLMRPGATAEPWIDLPHGPERVLVTAPASVQLQAFLSGTPPPGRSNQTVARLLSDDLPPLEDLVVGGHPAAIGRGSIVALLIGGLLLVYRGLAPLRVPALALLACYLTLIGLPLPAGVGGGATRRWLFERDPRVGWAAGLTLVHYLLATSAVPLTATFFLTQAGVRPGGRWAAAGFATVFGIVAAVATVFVSVAGGALLALVLMQLLWERRQTRARTLDA